MIGVCKRIIAFENEGAYMVMFNPEIVKKAGPYAAQEGCLSLTGTRPASRWTTIKVRWQNERFQQRLKTFTGCTAQILSLIHIWGVTGFPSGRAVIPPCIYIFTSFKDREEALDFLL